MSAFLFVPLLAAAWIIGFFVSALASHYFLTIVESSTMQYAQNTPARGGKFNKWIRSGIDWSDDLFTNYFVKVFYFAYLIGIWAGPAVIAGRLTFGNSPWATVLAAAVFWLLFPIGLLSSLASESRWTPFWSGILVAMFRRPVQALAFYALSVPVLAIIFLTFDLIMFRTASVNVVWSIALSPLAVLAFFVYARLIGRLGLIVTHAAPVADEPPRPIRKRPKIAKHAYDMSTRAFGPKEDMPYEPPLSVQPSALAAIETPHDGPIVGYDIESEDKPAVSDTTQPAAIIHTFDDEDYEPIVVAPPPETADTDRHREAEKLATPPQRELDLVLRDRPQEPTNPYGTESISFLFDPKSLDPWFRLTLGLVIMALIQRGLDILRPE